MSRRRNRWRIGVHLVKDDESGKVYYSDQVKECWDGTIRHHSQYETRNPQEFIRAKSDPKPVHPVRPDDIHIVEEVTSPLLVGNSSIATPVGPATHLFRVVVNDTTMFGLGEMIIEDPGEAGFIVE